MLLFFRKQLRFTLAGGREHLLNRIRMHASFSRSGGILTDDIFTPMAEYGIDVQETTEGIKMRRKMRIEPLLPRAYTFVVTFSMSGSDLIARVDIRRHPMEIILNFVFVLSLIFMPIDLFYKVSFGALLYALELAKFAKKVLWVENLFKHKLLD